MEKWVATFENWEICDSFCMELFNKTSLAIPKAIEWSTRSREFEKRAGFVIMAAYGFADKKSDNEVFEQFFPYILKEATDNRIYVKKAVNWALRSIGKRNEDLLKIAIDTAKEIAKIQAPAAQWIAKDALRELTNPKVTIYAHPRTKYQKRTKILI